MFQIISFNPLDQFECDDFYKCLQFRHNRRSVCREKFDLFDIDQNYFIIDYEDLSFESIKARKLRKYFINYPEFHKEFLFSSNYFSIVFASAMYNYLVSKTYFFKKVELYDSFNFNCPAFSARVQDNCFFFEIEEVGLGITFSSNGYMFINREHFRLPLVSYNSLNFYFCNCVQCSPRMYLLNILIIISDSKYNAAADGDSYNIAIIVDLGEGSYKLHSKFGELEGKLLCMKDAKSIISKNLFLFG